MSMNRWTVIVSGGMLEEEFVTSVLENQEIEFVIGVDTGWNIYTITTFSRIILWEILTVCRMRFCSIMRKKRKFPFES